MAGRQNYDPKLANAIYWGTRAYDHDARGYGPADSFKAAGGSSRQRRERRAHEAEKFRRWDTETARQESPGRPGYGVHDRVMGVGSAGRNEEVLREHVNRQYSRKPAELSGHIDGALNHNLMHDPSRVPVSAEPNGPRTMRSAPKAGVLDVVRSLDTAQDAASTSRAYADAQAARKTRMAGPRRMALIEAPSTGQKMAAVAQKAHVNLARANPAMMLMAGALAGHYAYDTVKRHGGTTGQAATAGAVAAAPMAGAAAAPSVIGRIAPTVAGGLAKLALPLTALTAGVGAVRGGMAAYKDGKSTGRIAGEAALGAADALTFGLSSKAWNAAGGDKTSLAIVQQHRAQQQAMSRTTPKGNAPAEKPTRDARRFDDANRRYEDQRAQAQPEESERAPKTYKDQWTDSRGRSYRRQDMSVRTAKDDA